MVKSNKLTAEESESLLKILQTRFDKNPDRHKGIAWKKIEEKLQKSPEKLFIINEMEKYGGEPDVVVFGKKSNEVVFCDCAPESPKERRSLCYDRDALNKRKEHKPKNSAIDLAKEIGIEMLTEEEYQELQKLGNFDLKTSSWLQTPQKIRKLGGAIFGDKRYEHVFIYHNGAESYYSARGFRGKLVI